MENESIASSLEELADLEELWARRGSKPSALRKLAVRVRNLNEPIDALVERKDLALLGKLGSERADDLTSLVTTGTCEALEAARRAVPRTLREVMSLPSIGAKTARQLWQEGNINSLPTLRDACDRNLVASLPSFGMRKQRKLVAILHAHDLRELGMPLATALELVRRVKSALPVETEATVVGDARRGVELVRDVLVLVKDMDVRGIEKAIAASKHTIELRHREIINGELHLDFTGSERVRVRGVSASRWVISMLLETGDAHHIRWLKERAKASSFGSLERIFVNAKTEESVYEALEIPFLPPELRDGSFFSAPADTPCGPITPFTEAPSLIPRVWGLFHVHTTWSDGTASIIDMAREAARIGYKYIGISDHTKAAIYAHGLDEERLRKQADDIRAARAEVRDVIILHGSEVDILPDGSLDFADDVLMQLDFVIASVHTHLVMSDAEMTARIVRAVSHPLVTILGHPTGRLLLGRAGFTFDLEKVARAAAANDTYLEINANAQRLDLSSNLIRRAAAQGARFAIDPDAHAVRGIADTSLGVMLARRAGLGPSQVLNAAGCEDALRTLAKRKERAATRLLEARALPSEP